MSSLPRALLLVFLQTILVLLGFTAYDQALLLSSGGNFLSGALIDFAFVGVMVVLQSALVVFGLRFCRVSLAALWRTDALPADIAIGVVGFLACAVVLLLPYALSGELAEVPSAIVSYSLAQRLLFILIGLQAGFVEESIFRGALQRALTPHLGAVVGIVVMALIFSAYHLKFNIGFAVKLVFGLVFGLLAQRRSLWSPATAHALIWSVFGSL